MENELRFYGFGNYYLSSLQQGLQAGHTIVELFNKYNAKDIEYGAQFEQPSSALAIRANKWKMLDSWAKDHKTMVLLNGGNSANLQELFEFLSNDSNPNPYPFAKFNEDEVSLNGALTYVGAILPARIFDTAAKMRDRNLSYTYHQTDGVLRIFDNTCPSDSQTQIKGFTSFEFELCNRLNGYRLAN